MIPRGVIVVAALFLVAGSVLLFMPGDVTLAWWVPLGFCAGQIAIGALLLQERLANP